MKQIPFNKPFVIKNEYNYIKDAISTGKISGNGKYTQLCHKYFENKFAFKKTLLTSSCTDALEMCAILCDLMPDDEVIMPSYTFVSTANAFVLRGAKIVFADSEKLTPNIDVAQIEGLINKKTKAIAVVHYGGVAVDMKPLLALAQKHNLLIVEDAAQAIDSYYNGKPLGSIGNLSAFSFHETKNIISGEGGLLAINDPQFIARAEIIWEKGTNRAAFFRGEVDKYNWVDVGSSFLASELVAAFLYAQLEEMETIQNRRKHLWQLYFKGLEPLAKQGKITLPHIPDYATNNAHLFYILTNSLTERTNLAAHLKNNQILAVFHYISLHSSPFYNDKHDGRNLPNTDRYSDTLLRLPMFYELQDTDVERIVEVIKTFYNK